VNAHLWEFPNAEVNGSSVKEAFKSIFDFVPPALHPLCTVKHSITRYRITLEAWHISFGGRSSTTPKISRARGARPSESGVWLAPSRLRKLAFTAAHKTVLHQFRSTADDVGSTRLRRVVSGVAPETIGKQRLQPFAQPPII
jgi:adenine-specific DNA glycosylase